MSSIWTLTVSFGGMTWRDLRELVSRANVANIPDEEPVDFAINPDFNRIGIVTRIDCPESECPTCTEEES